MSYQRVEKVLILPLQDQVVFPHQKFGVCLTTNIFNTLCSHCEKYDMNSVGLVCIREPGASLSTLKTPDLLKKIESTVGKKSPKSNDGESLSDGKQSVKKMSFEDGIDKSVIPWAKKGDIGKPPELCRIGTYGRLLSHRKSKDGIVVGVQGKTRLRIVDVEIFDYYGIATIELIPDIDVQPTPEILGLVDSVHTTLKKVPGVLNQSQQKTDNPLADLLHALLEEKNFGQSPGKRESFSSKYPPHVLADTIAANYKFSIEEQQRILQTFNIQNRLSLVLYFLQALGEAQKISKEINTNLQKKTENEMKEMIIRRQIGALKKELAKVSKKKGKKGDADDWLAEDDEEEGEDELQTIKDRLRAAGLPKDAQRIAKREIQRLSSMQSHHPEYTVCRTYLETLASLPWVTKTNDDALDLSKSEHILESDHYGLYTVKKRVLEFLAVRKLRKDMRGPILCLLGPPGVGKTSLGKSIAKSMGGRKFQRIALGGLRDEAELRGHRRTYIGSMPGVIIQALQQAQTNNPVILLDEVDKLAHDNMSNPQGSLLEILDAEQNNAFKDHYLNTPFDLSNIFFIATCNDLSTIDRPLRDRMEILELSGYTVEEKIAIGLNYLLPKQRKVHGLEDEDLPPPSSPGSPKSGGKIVKVPEVPESTGGTMTGSSNGGSTVGDESTRGSTRSGSTGSTANSSIACVPGYQFGAYHYGNSSSSSSDFRSHQNGLEAASHNKFYNSAAELKMLVSGVSTDGVSTADSDSKSVETKLIPTGNMSNGQKRKPRLEITRGALNTLITKYTAESGVRSLERRIAEICRWVAYDIVQYEATSGKHTIHGRFHPAIVKHTMPDGNNSKKSSILKNDNEESMRNIAKGHGPDRVYTVQSEHVKKICGMETNRSETLIREGVLVPGVAVGLAVTYFGGEILFVESAKVKGTGSLTITGQLGDVMKESVRAALSLLKQSKPEAFNEQDLHVHFPAGAVPKDGPSAGVATTLAIASLFLNRPCRADTAVTGEITLTGQVLPVGGIKEKILAANRTSGIKYVLIPALNKPNVMQEVYENGSGKNLLQDLQVVYVNHVRDALVHTFGAENEFAAHMVGKGASL